MLLPYTKSVLLRFVSQLNFSIFEFAITIIKSFVLVKCVVSVVFLLARKLQRILIT